MGLQSKKYSFWNHGVTVIPEFSPTTTGTDNGLYLRRGGFGAVVRQKVGTTNWFHIPIPTPTTLDDGRTEFRQAWLRAEINQEAKIKLVNLHEAISGSESRIIYTSGNVDYEGLSETFHFDLPHSNCVGPLVMSIFVEFCPGKQPVQVIFRGAGVHFVED